MENCCKSCCITKELSLCVFGRDSKTSPRWVHSAADIWKRLKSECVTIWEHPVLYTSKSWLTEFLTSPFFGWVLVDLKLTRLSFLQGVYPDFCTRWSHKMYTLVANELYQVVVICSENCFQPSPSTWTVMQLGSQDFKKECLPGPHFLLRFGYLALIFAWRLNSNVIPVFRSLWSLFGSSRRPVK